MHICRTGDAPRAMIEHAGRSCKTTQRPCHDLADKAQRVFQEMHKNYISLGYNVDHVQLHEGSRTVQSALNLTDEMARCSLAGNEPRPMTERYKKKVRDWYEP
jgi:hypothetical protein